MEPKDYKVCLVCKESFDVKEDENFGRSSDDEDNLQLCVNCKQKHANWGSGSKRVLELESDKHVECSNLFNNAESESISALTTSEEEDYIPRHNKYNDQSQSSRKSSILNEVLHNCKKCKVELAEKSSYLSKVLGYCDVCKETKVFPSVYYSIFY